MAQLALGIAGAAIGSMFGAPALGFAIGSYLSFGTHLWLLADTRQGLTLSPWALCVGTMAFCVLVAAGCSAIAVAYWLDGAATSGRDARQSFVLAVFFLVFALSAVGGIALIARAMRLESARPAAHPPDPARGAPADEQH